MTPADMHELRQALYELIEWQSYDDLDRHDCQLVAADMKLRFHGQDGIESWTSAQLGEFCLRAMKHARKPALVSTLRSALQSLGLKEE